jgi:hypothetical protein
MSDGSIDQISFVWAGMGFGGERRRGVVALGISVAIICASYFTMGGSRESLSVSGPLVSTPAPKIYEYQQVGTHWTPRSSLYTSLGSAQA